MERLGNTAPLSGMHLLSALEAAYNGEDPKGIDLTPYGLPGEVEKVRAFAKSDRLGFVGVQVTLREPNGELQQALLAFDSASASVDIQTETPDQLS